MRTARRITVALAALIMAGSVTARADCTFSSTQAVEISSTHWNDVLFFNYDTMNTSVAGPVFGNRSAVYDAPKENWLGAFVYDYLLAAYVEAQYSRLDRFGLD